MTTADPVRFRLRAFEADWLGPLAQARPTPLTDVLLAEATCWLDLGQRIGYFGDESELDIALRPLPEEFAGFFARPFGEDPAALFPGPDGGLAGFEHALVQAQDDLRRERRTFLELVLFADEGAWHVRLSRLRQLAEDLSEHPDLRWPPAAVEDVAWGLTGAESELPRGTRYLPAHWRSSDRSFMQVMSPDAQSRLAQLDKARAAIAEAVPSWEIDTPVRSASAGAGTVVAPGIELYRATAQPLGIETRGGLMTTLIERDTRVPARQSERFSTAEDDQTAVEISVFQGPGATVAENRRLVSFQLADLKPAPRGVPDIEVTFDIDASGVLTVSARNVQTGDEQAVTVVDIVGEKTSAAHDTAKGDTAFSTMTPESYADAREAAAGEELEPGGGEAMEAG